jgi:uncharacterized protein YjbI with pentapeptide repeats
MEANMAQSPEQQSKDSPFVRLYKWVRGTWQRTLVVTVLVIVLLVSLAIWLYWWPQSGFDDYQGKDNFQRGKTLWDWLGLLIIPAALAGGAIYFSRAERKNDREIAARQAALDRELADNRANAERERADDALRQALVQDYLDRMSELLFDRGLATSTRGDLVKEVTRARTFTVLRGLGEDGARKGYIVQFLHETGLIRGKEPIVGLWGASLQNADLAFVMLPDAYLSEANLYRARLSGADLSRASLIGAELGEASLIGANLYKADLDSAELYKANLVDANLYGANLSGAYLGRARLSGADLGEASLIGTNFSEADLRGASLRGANLNAANLTGAIVTNEQLSQARSLEEATMSDGSKYAGMPPTLGKLVAPSSNSAVQNTGGNPAS